jgi:hypothetical protein
VFWWNATHEWASLRFQVGRAANASRGVHVAPFLEILAGQIGYILPWVWAPLMWASWHAVRRGRTDERSWLLLWLAAGPIVVFTLVTLGGSRGLPHWQGPGYLFLTPLLGMALATRWHVGATWPLTWMRRSAMTIVALATIVVTQSAFGWVNRLAPTLFTKGDPSLEAVGWHALSPTLASRGLLADSSIAYMATTHWIEAAKAAVAVRGALPVLALTNDPRGFQFAHDPAAFVGRHGLLVRRASEAAVDSATRSRFRAVEPIGARLFGRQSAKRRTGGRDH